MDNNELSKEVVARSTVTPAPNPIFVVAIAASAGGLKALSRLVSSLPAEFPACILIVQHLSPNYPSLLAEILSQRTALKVKQAEPGDLLMSGFIYIAPPGWHMIIDANGAISLSDAVPVHFVRPSADVLFDSLAHSYKDHAIAVVLTGSGLDGADGVKSIKAMGGTVIAQDKATSEFYSMPDAAIHTGSVDFILPLDEIALRLIDLVSGKKNK